ncbi:MAG: 5-carboxymethyl-2-hydroxymuconate isomerase [Alphaproteobacteria bacterium]|nr:5-carboxymethyl-2-hydroxymuconate isomerase [Alphaproteobacteria bacterium]
MKLVTFSDARGQRVGVISGEGVVDLSRADSDLPRDMIGLIAEWPRVRAVVERAASRAADAPLKSVKLRAPVPRPRKIMAIGLNYADHVAESGMKTPEQQIWFSKMPSAVTGPYDPIQLPKVSTALDYEVELVAVVGQGGRHIGKANAEDAVFGYCAGNDVTVRDWQFKTPQWVLGKSFDTHAPFGPWIVTTDEIGDPHTLGVRCFVNGEKRQDSNTKHLVFNVFDQIEELSKAMTLEPGDAIFTGTPGGVGAAMKPPAWLKAGDEVRCEIDRIGEIVNVVAPEGN